MSTKMNLFCQNFINSVILIKFLISILVDSLVYLAKIFVIKGNFVIHCFEENYCLNFEF